MGVPVYPRLTSRRTEMVLAAIRHLQPVVQQNVVAELVRLGAVDAFELRRALHASAQVAPAGTARVTSAIAPVTTSAGSAPRDRASQTIQAERQRVEQEKYSFTEQQRADVDAFNAKRAKENAPHEAALAKCEAEIAAVEADPALAPAARAKKLEQLNKARSKIQEQIKPLVSLEQVTAEVDAISSDESLSQDQKKKQLEELRKKYDLPENKGFMGLNGPVNMHDLFTGRLGKIYKESAKRIDVAAKVHQQELKAELALIENTRGKKSPEYVAAQRELEEVDRTYRAEHDRLKQQGDFLYDLYRPKSFWESLCGFFKKAFGFIAKVFDLVMPVVRLIPGVGQIAGAVWSGVKTVANLVTGNFKGAVSSLLEALPGVGGVVGKIAGYVDKGVNLVRSGVNAVSSVVRGDVAGALRGAAGVAGHAGAGDVAKILDTGATATDSVTRLARGDVAGALRGAAGVAGDVSAGDVAKILDTGATAADSVTRLAQGDVAGALRGAGGVAQELGVELPAPVRAIQTEVAQVRERVERQFAERIADADELVRRVYDSRDVATVRNAIRESDDELTRQMLVGLYRTVTAR